ncbi:MAG: DUF3526 domain-containing protein [Candidatus Neomarinimicrobiota bacterium]|nr:DUF3526 domain-containing protein [Candidatus Neomarinimicrobiota bacterium]
MIINIFKNECKNFTRNKILVYLNIILIVSLFSIAWVSNKKNNNQKNLQETAQNKIRKQWENLSPMNPHGAAHYGSYAFKPLNILNSLDQGINDVTGNVLKLEGHVRNEIVYSEASQSISISKFGKLQASIILQYVIPIMIIFISFGSISKEKTLGRIKLLILQGVTMKNLFIAKSLFIWSYGLLLLIITLFFQIYFSPNIDSIPRLIFFLFSYSAYYFILSFLTVYISTLLNNNASILTFILSIWILWTIFLPKIFGNIVEKTYPLPSRQTLELKMTEDRSKGIDGHNPFDEKRNELKTKYLAQYEVDSLSQLPINFDGIVMQADEEFGNSIWDKHFGNNDYLLKKQKNMYQLLGIINPFISLQNLSMGICGSDMIHHIDFLEKSEKYRRYFIKKLNNKHAFGGSKTGDWSFKVNSDFFRSIDAFSYTTPKINTKIKNYIIDIIFLSFWVIISISLIFRLPKNIIK